MEHVPDTYRLACMNLMLHGIESDPQGAGMRYGDTLSPDGMALPKASLILTNPPFGSKKGGGEPDRPDFDFRTSNKQFCFLQHIFLGLKPGGRAAAIFPDNVLFESNVGRQIRVDLMDKCNLHTILRLPSGIFYAQGVKTNVLFFTRGKKDKSNTKEVWVYDLRSNVPQFGKRTSLMREHFDEFEASFGDDPLGGATSLVQRSDGGEQGRFRRFSREWIAERNDNLDISWLKDERDAENGELPEPAILAQEAMGALEAAIVELQGILKELGKEVSV
jgi:type I restriction enzyme M protein